MHGLFPSAQQAWMVIAIENLPPEAWLHYQNYFRVPQDLLSSTSVAAQAGVVLGSSNATNLVIPFNYIC